MKVLTYTSYKEHCLLYTKIDGTITVNSCQIGLTQKDIILLLEVSIVIYKVGKHTGVKNEKFIYFNIPAGTYSIDHFNAKIAVLIRRQRKDWGPPQIKDLKLVIPEDYTSVASNNIFIALGIPSLDTSPRPISLSLHCKQINKIKNELDGQPSSLLACMHVSNYKANFSPIHLVFLELDIDQPHLDFKILDENNNEVIRKTFCLQLLNKQ